MWHVDGMPAPICVADTPECPANDLCRVLEKFKFPGKCLEGRLHSSRRITGIANAMDRRDCNRQLLSHRCEALEVLGCREQLWFTFINLSLIFIVIRTLLAHTTTAGRIRQNMDALDPASRNAVVC